MKLTKKKLRTLIAEELNNVLREGGAVGHMVELTDGNATEADISAAWPEGVMYNGVKVFDTFYSDAAMSAQWAFVERAGYDDGQEAYLGYDPQSDVFVMGFDAFGAREPNEYGELDEGGDMEAVVIELRGDGTPMDVFGTFPGSMYPNGRAAIKQALPGIIDVRLD